LTKNPYSVTMVRIGNLTIYVVIERFTDGY
jgi:hypothetical protein